MLELASGCQDDSLSEIDRRVLAEEKRLAAQAITYADDSREARFRPTGMFMGRHGADPVTWVYSRWSLRQIGLVWDGNTWVPRQERRGPRHTLDCRFWQG